MEQGYKNERLIFINQPDLIAVNVYFKSLKKLYVIKI